MGGGGQYFGRRENRIALLQWSLYVQCEYRCALEQIFRRTPHMIVQCTVTATCTGSAINLHRLYSLEGIPKDCLRLSVGSRARIFKLLRSPIVDSKESIPPAFVAGRYDNPITTRFLASTVLLKIPAQATQPAVNPLSYNFLHPGPLRYMK